jgi:hypothetical protein
MKTIEGEVVDPKERILPDEYDLIQRVKDLWANNNDDLTIRSILGLSMSKWRDLMKQIKELDELVRDNGIAYQKFIAKSQKRAKDLEELRLYATSNGEINSAIKCFQLESDIDKQAIEMGQKLGVLAGEVVRIEKYVKNENSVEVLFQAIPEDKRLSAEEDLKLLTQQLLSSGVELNGSSEPTGN